MTFEILTFDGSPEQLVCVIDARHWFDARLTFKQLTGLRSWAYKLRAQV